MANLTITRGGKVERVPETLSERLLWIAYFGKPGISVVSEGWHAKIDMNTNTTGASFTVRSEFNMATPEAAVQQLIERMLTALAAQEARNG